MRKQALIVFKQEDHSSVVRVPIGGVNGFIEGGVGLDLRQTAFHEAGHVALSYLLLPDVKIEQVTIAPSLRTLGFICTALRIFPATFPRRRCSTTLPCSWPAEWPA